MPNLSKTIDIIFNGVDQTGRGVDSAFRNLSRLDYAVQGVAQPLSRVTDGIIKFESALALSAGAVAAYSVKLSGDFDTAFREIATLIDKPIGELGEFRQAILDYAGDSTQSLDQITSAVYSAISAGTDYSDSLAVVRQAEELAVAGKADLSDALLVLVSSLNAYGEGAGEAERYSDLLFQTVRQGQTTLPELASSLSQVTGIAASAGVGFGELLSAVAALTSTGSPTAQAITQVRQAIAAILKPTSEAQRLAKELGIQFNAEALQAKGLHGVLGDVQEATGGNTQQMAKLFGSVEALNGVLVLTGEGAEQFAANLKSMEDASGATDRAFAKMAQSVDLQVQRIANAARGVLIEFGTPMLDELGSFAEAVPRIFQEIARQIDSGALTGIAESFEEVAQLIADAAQNIAANLPQAFERLDVSGLVRSFKNLGEEMGEVFDNILGNVDLSTPEGLAEAMQRIVDLLAGLTNVTAGIVDELQPVFAAIGDLADRSGTAGEAAQKAAGNFLGAMKLLASFGTVLGSSLVVLKESGADIKRVFDVFAGSIKVLVNGAQTAFDTLALTAVRTMEKLNAAAAKVTFGDTSRTFAANAAELQRIAAAISQNLQRNAGEARQGLEQVGRGFSLINDEAKRAGGEGDKAMARIKEASEKAKKAVAEAEKEFGKMGEASKGAAKELKQQGVSAEHLAKAVDKYGDAFQVVGGKIIPDLEKADQATKQLTQSTRNQIQVIRNAAGEVVGYRDGWTGVKAEYDQTAKKTEEVTQATGELQTKLEQIASNERIKNIELAYDFRTAELEQQTERVLAAFESIDNTISDTGRTVSSLTSTFANLDFDEASWSQIRAVKEALRSEEKRRDEAAKKQQELIDTQINAEQERAEAFSRDGVKIEVNADGLEPHLESIWFEIMKVIQVRANEEGAEFLLGI